ncbi:MAG: hypothetical protein AAGF11_24745 [Myxococcota bacterium]
MAVTLLGLATWLATMLGVRAWLGGKAYLTHIYGSEAIADEVFAKALTVPELQLAGLDPWMLLAAFCVVVSAVFVVVVLVPWEWLLRRLGVDWRLRVVVGGVVGALAAGAVLWSIHPLLSLPDVPEGPRTVLNFACEAAGYGWVNAIVYLGAIAAGIVVMGWGRRVKGSERPNADPTSPAPSDTHDAHEREGADTP